MSVKLHEFNTYKGTERTGIGANSTDTSTTQNFVSKTGGVVSLATTSGEVVGVSLTQKAFPSDNETVAKYPLNYIPQNVSALYDVTITGGSITISNEQQYFNLTDSVTVNGASASTTTGQLRMVKFVSATNSTFSIENK